MVGEAMLYVTGVINRIGSVEQGNTVSDFEEEEIRRNLSLSTSILPLEFKNHKINLLDTPGYTDFIGEVISALRVADSAVVTIDAVAGVEVGTEVVWGYCDTFNLPRFVLISKMDRETASYDRAMESVRTLNPELSFISAHLPWGEKQEFRGVIDLLSMSARPADGEARESIPDEYVDQAEAGRLELVEAVAEGDDELLEKYLEGEDLTPEEIQRGLKSAVRDGRFVPVFLASGTEAVGIIPLMEAILELMPSPGDRMVLAEGLEGEVELEASDTAPLAAYVWKTTADPFVGKLTYLRLFSGVLSSDTRVWNHDKETEERLGTLHVMRGKEQIPVEHLHAGDIGAVSKLAETGTGDTLGDKGQPLTVPMPEYPNALYSVAVSPKTQADSAKMGPTLTRLCDEDPTLSWHQEAGTRETLLQGLGDQHIDVAIRKAEAKFQLGLDTKTPKVPYQETITSTGHAEYRHKKQTGGAGQFAEVHMRIEPLEDEEFQFENEVFGGAISQGFMPAIEKGVRGVMRQGVIAGYPVTRVLVAVTDGKEHPVDSKAIAFEIAGREAFKRSFRDASPVLLEPIMTMSITVPEESMGDVLGDLNTRRARVQGMDSRHGRGIVTAQVPHAEVLRYTSELRSMTGGRGVFTMELSHYEVVPAHVAEEIIAAKQREESQAEAG